MSVPEIAASPGKVGLIDEYHLYMNPVVLGGGKPFFANGTSPALRQLGAGRLPQDVTWLRYAAT